MKPIYLYLDNYDDAFAISIGHDGEFIKTPGGKVFASFNEKIVENTIYELQRYSHIEIQLLL
jgi:hypothetical protein